MPRTKKLHWPAYTSHNLDGESESLAYCGLHNDSDVEWSIARSFNMVTCESCLKAHAARARRRNEKYLSNYPFGHDSL